MLLTEANLIGIQQSEGVLEKAYITFLPCLILLYHKKDCLNSSEGVQWNSTNVMDGSYTVIK